MYLPSRRKRKKGSDNVDMHSYNLDLVLTLPLGSFPAFQDLRWVPVNMTWPVSASTAWRSVYRLKLGHGGGVADRRSKIGVEQKEKETHITPYIC